MGVAGRRLFKLLLYWERRFLTGSGKRRHTIKRRSSGKPPSVLFRANAADARQEPVKYRRSQQCASIPNNLRLHLFPKHSQPYGLSHSVLFNSSADVKLAVG